MQALLHPSVYMVRRLIFALVIVFLQNSTSLQICAIVCLQVNVAAFQSFAAPFEAPLQNRLEGFNEAMTLACTYFLFIFLQWRSSSARYRSGWLMISLIISIFVCNIYVLIKITIKKSYRDCLRRRRRRAHLRAFAKKGVQQQT